MDFISVKLYGGKRSFSAGKPENLRPHICRLPRHARAFPVRHGQDHKETAVAEQAFVMRNRGDGSDRRCC
jgi:hypothetical protein